MKTQPTRSTALRQWVENRDGGICALCGCDTGKTQAIMMTHARNHLKDLLGFNHYFDAWNNLIIEMMGFTTWPRSWWEADHIIPLSEGGADTLENLRTLCLPCHRDETAKSAGRRAKSERLRKKRPHRKYQGWQLNSISERV